MLDVDGPLSDPTARRSTSAAVRDGVAELALRGWLIAFNTGRALSSVRRMVLDPWSAELAPEARAALLEVLVVSCEKGAVMASDFAGPAGATSWVDPSLRVPQAVNDALRRLVAERFADVMMVDDAKQTMVSIEMLPELDGGIARYRAAQAAILPHVAAIVAAADGPRLQIEATIIAVDVERGGPTGVSKALGARRIVEAYGHQGLEVSRAVTIGDSASDVAMAVELRSVCGDVRHVHVGAEPVPSRGSRVEMAPSPYEAGTSWAVEGLLG